jgi:hypothetical protein
MVLAAGGAVELDEIVVRPVRASLTSTARSDFLVFLVGKSFVPRSGGPKA